MPTSGKNTRSMVPRPLGFSKWIFDQRTEMKRNGCRNLDRALISNGAFLRTLSSRIDFASLLQSVLHFHRVSVRTMATSLVTTLAPAALLTTEAGTPRRACIVQQLAVASSRACSGLFSENVSLRQRARAGQRMRLRPVSAVLKSVDISKIVPQGDRVFVRLEEVSDKSVGGVLLPRGAAKFERYLVGEVLAVGGEVTSTEKGQKVVFSDVNAYEVNLGGPEKVCFCKEKDLLAVVE